MKKPVRQSKSQHHMADSFAQSGLNARRKNDPGRAVILYEHALNFELEAINTFSDGTITSVKLLDLYRNAVSYARECGRNNKAKHLIEAVLAQDLSSEMVAEFEDLLARN